MKKRSDWSVIFMREFRLFRLLLASVLVLGLLSGCQTMRVQHRVYDPQAGIPFRFENGLIWAEVDSGRGVLQFIVDTGAGATVLSQQAARKLRVRIGEAVPIYGVSMVGVGWKVSGFDGSLQGIPLGRDLYALNLRQPHGASRVPDGMIGDDFFRGRVVVIDYKARRIFVREKAGATPPGSIVVPLTRHHDALCLPVSVNGLKAQWTRLDTGCVTALEWGAPFGRDLNSPVRRPMAGVVTIGGVRHEGVLIGVHPKPLFHDEAGLLGNEFLSRYRVTIDAVGMRLILSP